MRRISHVAPAGLAVLLVALAAVSSHPLLLAARPASFGGNGSEAGYHDFSQPYGGADRTGVLPALSLGSDRSAGRVVPTAAESDKPTFSESVKSGFEKFGKMFSPKKKGPDADQLDPELSMLSHQKPGPTTYVAMGRYYEQTGKLDQAYQQYRIALDKDPNNLDALLGCAALLERRGQVRDALTAYTRAAAAHPENASVMNNLGLCYARQGALPQSLEALDRAVQLKPAEGRYRNNAAMVLVELGRYAEALGHLRAVHDEAAAYYNMGYLLQKKGDTAGAKQYFSAALAKNPQMAQAGRWLSYLRQNEQQIARTPTAPTPDSVRLGSRPDYDTRTPATRGAPAPQAIPPAGSGRYNWQPNATPSGSATVAPSQPGMTPLPPVTGSVAPMPPTMR